MAILTYQVSYVGAMNPTAGSFAIIDRMQRHFAIFACLFPGAEVLNTIYLSILSGHLANFAPELSRLAEPIVNATIALHAEVAGATAPSPSPPHHLTTLLPPYYPAYMRTSATYCVKVSDAFLPTAIKFHYQWNLRELSAVTQGLCLATPDYYNQPLMLARLWLHEVHRVYSDRLVNETDSSRFDEMVGRISQSFFEDLDTEALQSLPLTFTTFAIDTQGDEKVYFSIDTYDKLKRSLSVKLLEYNEANARMDLVLFEQAMEHVCRISRIIDNPHRGNALLVGVGGSGKQSLSRLAAFISGFSVFQVAA